MKKSRLEELLEHFNPKESKKLRKFLCSPFFNQQQSLVRLYDYCVAQKGKQLDKEATYKAIFPDKKFKESDLRLQKSYLYRLIEKFIAYAQIEIDDFLVLQKTVEGFQQRNLSEFALRNLKKARDFKEKQALRDADYYNHLHQLNLTQYTYEINFKPTEQQDTLAFKELDIAYYITKLKLACFLLSQQTTYQSAYDLSNMKPVLEQIKAQNLLVIPNLATFYYCYLTLIEPTVDTHFENFNKLLLHNSPLFSQKENGNLYLLAINYCIKQINQSNTAFYKKTLDLYKAGLLNQALLENGILSRFVYQNIVTSGMRVGELQWTRQFLIAYKETVEKDFRESAFRFNMARLAYHEKNYEEAMDLLRDTDQADLLINLYAKNLLLKIYYELGEFKLLDSFLDAFQIYLRRKKGIASHKKNYWNMIYYTQKLMKVNPFNAVAKDKLKAKIEAEPVLLERPWLLEQLSKC